MISLICGFQTKQKTKQAKSSIRPIKTEDKVMVAGWEAGGGWANG